MTDDRSDLIRAFCAADREVLVTRAQSVGALTSYLRDVEGWAQVSEADRREFAARAYFARWRVRQGALSDG